MKPTDIEINELASIMESRLSTRFLNILLSQSESFKNVISIVGENLTNIQKVRLLIHQKESRLFMGSADRTIELRKKLLSSLEQDKIDELFEKYCTTSGNSRTHKLNQLSSKRWHSGKSWAIRFVNELNIPMVFAGIRGQGKLPNIEDIDPYVVPPKLTDFQKELKDNLLLTLNKDGDSTRCIVSLPTGGGKTRTAVEAFIEWLQPRFSQGKYLIWIAQSEELCEQAIECIRQMWASKQFYESLRIYRYFGGSEIDESELIGGVVVSSINQLYSRLSGDVSLVNIVKKTGAIIIDEAHRAATQMYTDFFRFCNQHHSPTLFPICGLTATPGRSFDDTPRLVSLFESKLFTPTLGKEFEDNPLRFFRQEGYLASPIPKQINTHVDIPTPASLFPETKEQFQYRMNTVVIGILAKDDKRNKLIIKTLLNIPKGKLCIVYACTVEHANMLSTIMNYKGRSSTSISSETPRHYRRKLLEQFKKGEIEFVFNYGVLTTGFDAPQTEYIVICRPTFSSVLYEQIVGRGLRGPRFGGTETCQIIDFSDNYSRFGDQQAYNRFSEFWN